MRKDKGQTEQYEVVEHTESEEAVFIDLNKIIIVKYKFF